MKAPPHDLRPPPFLTAKARPPVSLPMANAKISTGERMVRNYGRSDCPFAIKLLA